MNKPATEDDIWAATLLLLLAVVLTAVLLRESNDQILDTLCQMVYPECVMGVDR